MNEPKEYRIFWSEEDKAWVAVVVDIPDYKHLSSVQKTPTGAMAGLIRVLKMVRDIEAEGRPTSFWARGA